MSLLLAPARRSAAVPEGWRFTSPPPADAGRWLAGRPVADGARMIPLAFNLCAAAHAAASAAALDLPRGDDGGAIAAEVVREQGAALFQTWPLLLGQAPDRAALALLGRREDAGLLAARVFGGLDISGLSLSDFDAWLRDGLTGPARLLCLLRQTLDPAWGRAQLVPLSPGDLDDALAHPATREATALERVRRTPLVAALLAGEGASLFVRLLARVVDFGRALAGGSGFAAGGSDRPGVGHAQAARGLLIHRAKVAEGRIAAYEVLTPSFWNLAPGGLLARMLAAVPARREAPLLAQLALAAVNPCMPVTLACGLEAGHA